MTREVAACENTSPNNILISCLFDRVRRVGFERVCPMAFDALGLNVFENFDSTRLDFEFRLGSQFWSVIRLVLWSGQKKRQLIYLVRFGIIFLICCLGKTKEITVSLWVVFRLCVCCTVYCCHIHSNGLVGMGKANKKHSFRSSSKRRRIK